MDMAPYLRTEAVCSSHCQHAPAPQVRPLGVQEDQGPSLRDLADAAALACDRPGAQSLLLSAEAKAAGVACSPAQLFFVAQHVVRCRA